MKRIIKAAFIIVGTVLVFGSPGACDRGIITLGQAMLQAVVGFAMWAAAYGLKGRKKNGKIH